MREGINQRVERIKAGAYPLKAKRNMIARLLLSADEKFQEAWTTMFNSGFTYYCRYDGKEYRGMSCEDIYTQCTGKTILIEGG